MWRQTHEGESDDKQEYLSEHTQSLFRTLSVVPLEFAVPEVAKAALTDLTTVELST